MVYLWFQNNFEAFFPLQQQPLFSIDWLYDKVPWHSFLFRSKVQVNLVNILGSILWFALAEIWNKIIHSSEFVFSSTWHNLLASWLLRRRTIIFVVEFQKAFLQSAVSDQFAWVFLLPSLSLPQVLRLLLLPSSVYRNVYFWTFKFAFSCNSPLSLLN